MLRAMTLGVLTAVAVHGSATAQSDEPYVDDRSAPQALVRSLYNAINRKEFSRAWSYFSVAPAVDLQSYAAGYADTAAVEVQTGSPAATTADGATVYTLPVVIKAFGADGRQQAFSGCYTIRFADPSGVEDFQPPAIVGGALAPANSAADLPSSCPGGPDLPPQDALLERAQARFDAAHRATCQGDPTMAPERHDIRFRYEYDTDAEPERVVSLFRFFCGRGAYNESFVYYFADELGDLRQLAFAEPELDIRYVDEGDTSQLDSMRIIGFTSSDRLINSEYDPQTRTIGSWSKWRGLGDASSIGKWMFRNGDFTLVRYDVDPTYDGEIEHTTVLDYDTGP